MEKVGENRVAEREFVTKGQREEWTERDWRDRSPERQSEVDRGKDGEMTMKRGQYRGRLGRRKRGETERGKER